MSIIGIMAITERGNESWRHGGASASAQKPQHQQWQLIIAQQHGYVFSKQRCGENVAITAA